jgi:hypothetical protein
MVIADTLAGIRREARSRPSARKAAITASELAAMIAAAEGQGTRSIRDRAILALGWPQRCADRNWSRSSCAMSSWSTEGLR